MKNNVAVLIGRAALALIFLVSGWSKFAGYQGTQGYMEAMGVPGGLLPLVIAAELLGGLAILTGFMTRWVALGFALFAVVTGFIFHGNFADQNQAIHFLKNIAMAGGFLVLYAEGAGAISLDAWLARQAAVRNLKLSSV